MFFNFLMDIFLIFCLKDIVDCFRLVMFYKNESLKIKKLLTSKYTVFCNSMHSPYHAT